MNREAEIFAPECRFASIRENQLKNKIFCRSGIKSRNCVGGQVNLERMEKIWDFSYQWLPQFSKIIIIIIIHFYPLEQNSVQVDRM